MKWIKQDCYGNEQVWYSEDAINKIAEDLKMIQNCIKTEVVEISTRDNYDGLIALKGISAKITEMLKDINESED